MPFGEGISKEGDLLDVAVDQAIIDKSGSWYSYNGERLGQGRNNAKAHLVDHPEVTAEIENKVREIYGLRPQSTTGSIPEDEANEDKSPKES
jgi:recombination protein RecA